MQPGDVVIQGSPVPFAAATPLGIPLGFLHAIAADAAACGKGDGRSGEFSGLALRELGIRVQATFTTAAGEALLSRAYPMFLDSLTFNDDHGERSFLADGGSALLITHQQCWAPGAVQYGPAIGASTALAVDFYLPIYREHVHLRKPSESRILLRDMQAARLSVVTSAAVMGSVVGNRATISACTITPYAVVIDEGPTLPGNPKLRVRYRSQLIQENDATYTGFIPRNARLLSWMQSLGTVADQNTTVPVWADQNISSATLRMSQAPRNFLKAIYRERKIGFDAADGEKVPDLVDQGTIVPIYRMERRQSVLECPIVPGALHWKTSAVYGAGTFVSTNKPVHVCAFVESTPVCAGDMVLTSNGATIPASSVDEATSGPLPTVNIGVDQGQVPG